MATLFLKRFTLCALALMLANSGPSSRAPAAEVGLVKQLTVFPQRLVIGGDNRRQQVLVTAQLADGRLADVTHQCEFVIENESVAQVHNAVIFGKSDGESTLTIRFRKHSLQQRITVSGFERYPAVNFRNDIMPLFSKLNCNGGGCHGKQGGQNGFHLSVFGFDPVSDFGALKKEARGRRVFPAAAASSLLIMKAAGQVPHGGGRRLEAGSLDFELLANWIDQGMPWGDRDAAQVTRIEIQPATRIMNPDADQQVLVTAVFSDGRRRDVTDAAAYTSNTETIANVNQSGRISVGKTPGEAAITINYMGHVGAVRVIVPRTNAPNPYPSLPINNKIDELVWAKLRMLGVVPSELCDDATFIRRLFVTAIGTLPTASEVDQFVTDKSANKRERAIESVLDRREFALYWSYQWADVLMVDRNVLGERGAFEFHKWLRNQVANNTPYDQWVRTLITASGNTGKYGPVNFFKALRTPEDLTKSVSQAFLGVRLDCAQCHHHPFDKWGQEDFYGMAGFFNGIKRKPLSADRELIFHGGYQAAKMPLTNELVPTRPLGGESPQKLQDSDPRVHLANWLTDKKNPWFARLAANRIWKHYLGRGLIEPEDDLRSTNPATNEALLDYLATQLVASKFNLRHLMRLILHSRVYQLSAETNATNLAENQNFSHHTVRRLPAEVLLDAISQVTGSPESFPGMPAGSRAIELWDNRLPSYFLDTFGRSARESPCQCGKSGEPTMAQALHLMNAPEIEAKIAHPRGRAARLAKSDLTQAEIVNQLSLTTLGRLPREKEKRIAAKLLTNANRQLGIEDLLWTLMNSYDFLFIH